MSSVAKQDINQNVDVNGKVYYFTGDGKIAYPAGAWKRGFTRLLDGIVASIPAFIFTLVYTYAYNDDLFFNAFLNVNNFQWSLVLAQVLAIVFPLIIFVVIPIFKEGQTPFKKVFKIKPMFLNNTPVWKAILFRETFITTFVIITPLLLLISGVSYTTAFAGYQNAIVNFSSSIGIITQNIVGQIDGGNTDGIFGDFASFIDHFSTSVATEYAVKIKEVKWDDPAALETFWRLLFDNEIWNYINTNGQSLNSLLDSEQIQAYNYFFDLFNTGEFFSQSINNPIILDHSNPLFIIVSEEKPLMPAMYVSSEYLALSFDTSSLEGASLYNLNMQIAINMDYLNINWFLQGGWYDLVGVPYNSISMSQVNASYGALITSWIYLIWILVLWISIGINRGKIGLHDRFGKTIMIDSNRIYETKTVNTGQNPEEILVTPKDAPGKLNTVEPTWKPGDPNRKHDETNSKTDKKEVVNGKTIIKPTWKPDEDINKKPEENIIDDKELDKITSDKIKQLEKELENAKMEEKKLEKKNSKKEHTSKKDTSIKSKPKINTTSNNKESKANSNAGSKTAKTQKKEDKNNE